MSVGVHYPWTAQGAVFSQAVTPIGLALPIYTNTALGGAGVCALPLFNPPGSGVIVELIQVDIAYASGTAAFCSILLMGLPLTAVGTGNLCTAFPRTDPVNGSLMSGTASKIWSYNGVGAVTVTAGTAAAPTVAAPGVWRTLAGINLEAETGTAHGTSIVKYTFDGTAVLEEGKMSYFAGGKATVALYATCVVWKEIPTNR